MRENFIIAYDKHQKPAEHFLISSAGFIGYILFFDTDCFKTQYSSIHNR